MLALDRHLQRERQRLADGAALVDQLIELAVAARGGLVVVRAVAVVREQPHQARLAGQRGVDGGADRFAQVGVGQRAAARLFRRAAGRPARRRRRRGWPALDLQRQQRLRRRRAGQALVERRPAPSGRPAGWRPSPVRSPAACTATPDRCRTAPSSPSSGPGTRATPAQRRHGRAQQRGQRGGFGEAARFTTALPGASRGSGSSRDGAATGSRRTRTACIRAGATGAGSRRGSRCAGRSIPPWCAGWCGAASASSARPVYL